MKVRIGIETGRKSALAQVRERSIPVLVSANTLWDAKRGRFTLPRSLGGLDLALDSGGFVAMKLYGRYRWSVGDYVKLARHLRPTWWAQMDYCCEPEIAADASAVRERIGRTVAGLLECQHVADGEGIAGPMPVLQGWKPEDYVNGPIYEHEYSWPKLVGVGSVCRRPINGPCGVLAVVEALNAKVPPGVQFHLFGVKSQAISQLLQRFPGRIASMDSQAWSLRARMAARSAGVACDNELRARVMVEWYLKQTAQAVCGSQQQLEL